MKVIAKGFLFMGLLFWGLGLIYSLSKLIALNGLGNLFEVQSPISIDTRIERDSLDIDIYYTYRVKENEYRSEYKMFAEYFNQCEIDTIIIKYNTTFPMVSYIEGVPLKIKRQKTGIFISSFFLLFLLLIWRFSKKDKWVKTYEEVGERPWLYPEDKSIKNPWIRLKSRLFKIDQVDKG